MSGDFHYKGSQAFLEWRTAGMSFHRDSGEPLRVYLSGDQGEADRHGAISPDGSWVAMAGNTSVARFEVAPVEKISCNQPIEAGIPIIGQWLDLPMVKVDYAIYKTGRASNLEQTWDLYAMPFGVLLGNVLTCSGDFSFNFPLLAPEGNDVLWGTREIDLPSCYVDKTIGIGGYDLVSILKNASGDVSYSKDQTTVLRLTIPEN